MSYEQAERFIKSINKGDKILIIYNNDADGIISACLMRDLIKNFSDNIEVFSTDNIDKKVLKKIKEINPRKLIILDISNTQAINFEEILQIDHHPFGKYAEGITITPEKEDNTATAYFVYNLALKFPESNIKKKKWMVGLGILSDWLFSKGALKILEELKKEDPLFKNLNIEVLGVLKKKEHTLSEKILLKKNNIMRKYYRTTKEKDPFFYVKLINVPFDYNREDVTFDLLCGLKSSESLINLPKDHEIYSLLKKREEITSKIIKNFLENMDSGSSNKKIKIFSEERIVFYEAPSTISPKAYINFLSIKYPEWVIVVFFSKDKTRFKISCRQKSGIVNLGLLMKKLCNPGGGHPDAAGGEITKKDWDKFVRNFLSEFKKK